MEVLRVFPRRTKATPVDQDVRIGYPTLFDEADKVDISVTFTWDKSKAEKMAEMWRGIANDVRVGGTAYDDPGDEFIPGQYLKPGYVITSRGCPNQCWFCSVPNREGIIRELEIKDGWNLLDNNLLACTRKHIEAVFEMLSRQHKEIKLTGGLEAKRLEPWHIDLFTKLTFNTIWLAYDTADDYDPLYNAAKMLREAGIIKSTSHVVRCYVLIGWEKDTIEKAEKRLNDVLRLGIMPMAMFYDHGLHRNGDIDTWRKFTRTWASPWIVGTKMRMVT